MTSSYKVSDLHVTGNIQLDGTITGGGSALVASGSALSQNFGDVSPSGSLTTLYTPTDAGMYRISIYMLNINGDAGSTNISSQVNFQDPSFAQSESFIDPVNGSTLQAASGGALFVPSAITVYSIGGNPIVLQLTGNAGGSAQYDLFWRVEQVNTAGGGGGSPAGPDRAVQFNNAGAFGGDSGLTWDGSYLRLGGGGYLESGGDTLLGNQNDLQLFLQMIPESAPAANDSTANLQADTITLQGMTVGLNVYAIGNLWSFTAAGSLVVPGQIISPYTSVSAPSYSFLDTDTFGNQSGMYYVVGAPFTAGSVRISGAGTDLLILDGATGNTTMPAGSLQVQQDITSVNGDIHADSGSVTTQTVTTNAGGLTLQSTSASDPVTIDTATGGSFVVQTDAGNNVWTFKSSGSLAYKNLTADPGTPVEGELYYNSTSHVFKYWNGTTWKVIATV